MSFKTTYFLFGLLALMLIVFGVALWMNPGKVDTSVYVFPGMHNQASPLPDTDITRVEIERTKPTAEKIVFVKDPQTNQWKIAEPLQCGADDFAVRNLVTEVYDARRDPNSEPSNDFKQYGLDPPAEVVTLVKEKEGEQRREVRLMVGEASGKDNAVLYVTSSDRPREVIAVSKSSLDAILKPLNDFRNRDLLARSSGDIQSVALSEGKKKIELKKTGDTGDNWTYVEPPYGRAEYSGGTAPAAPGKAPDGVQSLLGEITKLRVEKVEDFVADHVKDLAKYHLDKDVLKIGIDRTEEISTNEKGEKARKTSHHVLLVGVGKKADEKADQYYAMVEGEGTVVKVSGKNIEPFRKLLDDPGALRDRNLVDTGGFKKPDAIDVKNSYGLLEFRRGNEPGKEWKLYRGEAAQAVDGQAVQALISMLTEKNAVTEFPEPGKKKQLGLDNPDCPVVSVWLDGIAEEKKDADKDKDTDKDADKDKKDKDKDKKDAKPKLKDPNKPTVVLRFGNLVSGSVAVERKFADEKDGTLVLVPGRILDQVREGPTAYLDRTLPPFAAGAFDAAKDVTKVVIERGGKTTEVTREKPDAPWKIVKPEERVADPLAVEDILRDLNGLRAEKLVTEKPGEKELGDWGLRPPQSKVLITLTRDGKPQTIEYDFGKEASGQNGVYARRGDGDTVYVIATSKLAVLDKELQDLKVFSFDPAKVRELKLTGWYDKVNGATEVLLKRKDAGQWTIEKPARKLELDAEKVRKLLDELSRLRAERFVAHKATPTEAQGLDVDKVNGALKVDITVEGEKEPYTLTVGNLDGDKGYFATSNKPPGDVFDVRKEFFEGPKKEAGYFFK